MRLRRVPFKHLKPTRLRRKALPIIWLLLPRYRRRRRSLLTPKLNQNSKQPRPLHSQLRKRLRQKWSMWNRRAERDRPLKPLPQPTPQLLLLRRYPITPKRWLLKPIEGIPLKRPSLSPKIIKTEQAHPNKQRWRPRRSQRRHRKLLSKWSRMTSPSFNTRSNLTRPKQ